MKSQALGRGLDALFGETAAAYENEGTQKDLVLELSLKEIKPNPYQPRKDFNEESLLELSESIKKDGLIQPIVVAEDIEGYTLIAGERRFRASKLAKLKTIRAIVLNSDKQQMREYALLENIQRDELNAIELSYAYSELIKLHELTHEELSMKIHKSRTHITNTVRLLQLSEKTQKALVDKKITAGHAKVMVGLDEKQQQVLVNSIIGQKLSVRDVELMIKNYKGTTPVPLKKEASISYDFGTIKDRFNSLGFKSKSSNNKLTIEFNNDDEIEKLLELLSKIEK